MCIYLYIGPIDTCVCGRPCVRLTARALRIASGDEISRYSNNALIFRIIILRDASLTTFSLRTLPSVPLLVCVAGCIQDGNHYRFEEKWSPVLIPRGTMHCVKCECLTVSTT